MFALWHEKNFGYAGTLGVEVHTGVLINEFLKTEEYWAIIPVSMAKEFTKERNLQIIRFNKNKPIRICYLIYDKNNRNLEDIYSSILRNNDLINDKLKLATDEITEEI